MPADSPHPAPAAEVLIVDHPPDSDRLRAAVAAAGYSVDVATSNTAAVKALRQQPARLVLTEFRGRDIDGWELLEQVKKHQPKTHVVFLLASIRLEMEQILRSRAVDGHIVKPVEERNLVATLRALLDPGNLDRTADAYLFLPDAATRGIVEPALVDAGIFARTFDDARSLAVTIDQDPPHLVVVDVGPDSPHGFTVCEAVRDTITYIPILAVAERVTRDDVLRAARLHVNDLILKPLERNDLMDSARKLLRQTKRARGPA